MIAKLLTFVVLPGVAGQGQIYRCRQCSVQMGPRTDRQLSQTCTPSITRFSSVVFRQIGFNPHHQNLASFILDSLLHNHHPSFSFHTFPKFSAHSFSTRVLFRFFFIQNIYKLLGKKTCNKTCPLFKSVNGIRNDDNGKLSSLYVPNSRNDNAADH